MNRKFRLHPGDILIISSKFAYAVDLPIGNRAPHSTILSWLVIPRLGVSALPVPAPGSKSVLRIDDYAQKCPEAKTYYEAEQRTFANNPGPTGEPKNHMQSLRVAPKVYEQSVII